ncbi:MAG: riboflavin synthase [Betaproteobacteria bacterium]|nr:riboflavin synthase [Betaproteobacteria bacterium]
MFTGIIEATGTIAQAETSSANTHLTLHAPRLGLHNVAIGDSIAVNGVCLTVVKKGPESFEVDVSPETLAATIGFAQGAEVNLEKSLRFGDRIGGHLVSGHVDGVGTVTAMEDLGASWRLEIAAPAELAKFVARKGSITVDGVSLTVNRVQDTAAGALFEINIIPHTHQVTNLKRLGKGAHVNLEVDQLARYVERMLGGAPAA